MIYTTCHGLRRSGYIPGRKVPLTSSTWLGIWKKLTRPSRHISSQVNSWDEWAEVRPRSQIAAVESNSITSLNCDSVGF